MPENIPTTQFEAEAPSANYREPLVEGAFYG